MADSTPKEEKTDELGDLTKVAQIAVRASQGALIKDTEGKVTEIAPNFQHKNYLDLTTINDYSYTKKEIDKFISDLQNSLNNKIPELTNIYTKEEIDSKLEALKSTLETEISKNTTDITSIKESVTTNSDNISKNSTQLTALQQGLSIQDNDTKTKLDTLLGSLG